VLKFFAKTVGSFPREIQDHPTMATKNLVIGMFGAGTVGGGAIEIIRRQSILGFFLFLE
jgi:hypothetical protein